jgi:arylsulfatase A-like enzyme
VEQIVNELMLARSHTRGGEPVVFGNLPHVMPGAENTYQSYGVAWANMSNTPFRLYKHWTHEGGVSTPTIIHWPNGISDKGGLRHTPCQLPDVMATVIELARVEYPTVHDGHAILPLEGRSLLPVIERDELPERPLFWEHEGNAAVRLGRWKLVKEYPGGWELYDMHEDRTETNDIASKHPAVVEDLARKYDQWAARCDVIPRDAILEMMRNLPSKAFWEDE